MKIRIYLLTLVLLSFASSCVKKDTTKLVLEKRIDSLELIVKNDHDFLQYLEKANPTILVSKKKFNKGEICCYVPFGLTLKLCHERPKFEPNIYLCVPSAYTDPNKLIDGLFIEDGKVISKEVNKMLTGACILSNNSIQIIDNTLISDSLIEQIQNFGKSFFQQTLLVLNSKLVFCDLFKNKENFRRALVQFEDLYCISESVKPVTIIEFQKSLVSAGAINAINLDMGSWSEGWYRNNEGVKIRMGDNFTNTIKQTNWIVASLDL